jgi:hypothetical protein
MFLGAYLSLAFLPHPTVSQMIRVLFTAPSYLPYAYQSLGWTFKPWLTMSVDLAAVDLACIPLTL